MFIVDEEGRLVNLNQFVSITLGGKNVNFWEERVGFHDSCKTIPFPSEHEAENYFNKLKEKISVI